MQTSLLVTAKTKVVDDEKKVLSHVRAEDWMALRRLRDLYSRLGRSKFLRRMREDSCGSRCHLGVFEDVRLWLSLRETDPGSQAPSRSLRPGISEYHTITFLRRCSERVNSQSMGEEMMQSSCFSFFRRTTW